MEGDKLKKDKADVIVWSIIWLIPFIFLICGAIECEIYSVLPSFFFQRATVHNFNLTASNQLTTNITVTFSARFPYKHHGVNYHLLAVHAAYGGCLNTLPTFLPASYQDHKHDAVWSPLISGNFVIRDHNLAMEASKFQARKSGKLFFNVIIKGRISLRFWKFTDDGCLYANCPAYLSFESTGEYLEQSCRAYLTNNIYCD